MPAGKEVVATPPVLVMSWPVLLTWPFYRTGSEAEKTEAPFPRGQESWGWCAVPTQTYMRRHPSPLPCARTRAEDQSHLLKAHCSL